MSLVSISAVAEGEEPSVEGEETSGENLTDTAMDAETDENAFGGKKQMTIGKMIMLGAIGVVAILLVAAGGIVWYVQSSRAAEERERKDYRYR